MKVCHLLSGGIDSSILLYWLVSKDYEVKPLFINYGQVAAPGEFRCAKYHCKKNGLKLEEVDIPKISKLTLNKLTSPNSSENLFYPNRNMLLLSIAGIYAYEDRCDVISIGLVKAGVFPDATREFIEQSTNLLCTSLGKQIAVISPFLSLDKKEAVYIGKQLNVSIFNTYSCVANPLTACSVCDKCKERSDVLKVFT